MKQNLKGFCVSLCYLFFSSINLAAQEYVRALPSNSNAALYGNLYIAQQSEMYVAANQFLFRSGNIFTDKSIMGGTISFSPRTQWRDADQNSHVNGNIKVYGQRDFVFPSGNQNVFQPLMVQQLTGTDFIEFSYHHKTHESNSTSAKIAVLHPEHFWEIRTRSGSGYLTLSWNHWSDLTNFVRKTSSLNPLNLLAIAGFNGTEWVAIASKLEENGLVDKTPSSLLSGAITSSAPIDFENFKAFALMLFPPRLSDELKVTEAVTPNGDGINDYWVIEDIENYPNAQIHVYNRLGREVLSARGYNNDWGGHYQEFKELLPEAPYFYIIDLDNNGTVDKQGWFMLSY